MLQNYVATILGGDTSIEILDVDEGSIKLILGGSEKALKRIEELFQSGGLNQVENIEVQDVHFLEKQEIASLIFKNGGKALNLSRADLSRANLKGAEVNNTFFETGIGLSAPSRRELASRGAIFDDGSGFTDKKLFPNTPDKIRRL